MIKFKADGEPVPDDEYLKIHPDLIHRDKWIIDGFGCVPSAWERFPAADTLIYADLPLLTHCRWVTKRFIKGLFASPEGWSVCTAHSADGASTRCPSGASQRNCSAATVTQAERHASFCSFRQGLPTVVPSDFKRTSMSCG